MIDKIGISWLWRREAAYVLGVTLTAMVLPSIVRAQQTVQIPVPLAQSTPHSSHPITLAPSDSVRTIPIARQAAASPSPESEEEPVERAQPAPAPRVVLPTVFRGCWRGRVDEVDDIQQLPGAHPIGAWMPKTYLLCYRRTGEGPFQLTFTEAGVEGNSRITNSSGQMELESTDGRSYAAMRAMLHFDEFRTYPDFLSGSTFAVDETTNLNCNITPDGMRVSGNVYGRHSGDPWFRAWWHATFVHIPSSIQ